MNVKKSVMIPSVVLASTFLLAACGTNTATNNSGSAPVTGQTTATNSGFPLTLTDDAGHKVTLTKAPQHIVSATEGTDEILSALVPKSEIAMVTAFSSDPDYSNITSFVKGIPAVSDAGSDVEKIIGSKPDLVLLASYTKSGVVNQIEQANIPTYEFASFNSINDIEHNIQVVGKLVGKSDAAKSLVDSMNQKLQSIESAVKGQKKVSVLDYSSFGFVAGNDTTVNDVIVDAGGINAAAKLQGWQKITDEEIVKMNPDVIIDASSDKGFVQKILSDPALQTVNAVKHHRVYGVNGADLSSVSQYVVQGVYDVAHVLYPSVNLPQ